ETAGQGAGAEGEAARQEEGCECQVQQEEARRAEGGRAQSSLEEVGAEGVGQAKQGAVRLTQERAARQTLSAGSTPRLRAVGTRLGMSGRRRHDARAAGCMPSGRR